MCVREGILATTTTTTSTTNNDDDNTNAITIISVTSPRGTSCTGDAVSFHNFKSQNFKLSVSSPKSK